MILVGGIFADQAAVLVRVSGAAVDSAVATVEQSKRAHYARRGHVYPSTRIASN